MDLNTIDLLGLDFTTSLNNMAFDESIFNNVMSEADFGAAERDEIMCEVPVTVIEPLVIEKKTVKNVSTTKLICHKRQTSQTRKKACAERTARTHKITNEMISQMYVDLPSNFILHETFIKVTKIQKLYQIHKFVKTVIHHGYKADK